MTTPTVPETTALVYKAFKKLGFGGKFATYDVIDRSPWIELVKIGGFPKIAYRILTQEQLNLRAERLVQNMTQSILEANRRFIGCELYTAARLAQNMMAKLVCADVSNFHMYYDNRANTIIIKRGTVIIEVLPKVNYDPDVSSSTAFRYLDELGELIDEVKGACNVDIYTVMDKLCLALPSGYVVETDCTAEEFNSHWEK